MEKLIGKYALGLIDEDRKSGGYIRLVEFVDGGYLSVEVATDVTDAVLFDDLNQAGRIALGMKDHLDIDLTAVRITENYVNKLKEVKNE